MGPKEARVGMRVRVRGDHRVESRRGAVGQIVGRYGGEECVAVDVRFGDRHYQLFSPKDLEEISSPQPWWRSLLGRESRS